LYCIGFPVLVIEDESGELAAQLTEKHLGDAELGNFTSMTPGLTDVRKPLYFIPITLNKDLICIL
jgi:hypothetical protein